MPAVSPRVSPSPENSPLIADVERGQSGFLETNGIHKGWLRKKVQHAFGHEQNPKFAEHAEHAFRGACALVFFAIPLLMPKGILPLRDYLIELGVYNSGVCLFIIFNLGSSFGHAFDSCRSGLQGNLAAAVLGWHRHRHAGRHAGVAAALSALVLDLRYGEPAACERADGEGHAHGGAVKGTAVTRGVVDYYSMDKPNKYIKDQVIRRLGQLKGLTHENKPLLAAAWWECYGFGFSQVPVNVVPVVTLLVLVVVHPVEAVGRLKLPWVC
eukprot:Skav225522  [mRNA]  locus=scaffold2440:73151:89174:+ [translate_table: standard]